MSDNQRSHWHATFDVGLSSPAVSANDITQAFAAELSTGQRGRSGRRSAAFANQSSEAIDEMISGWGGVTVRNNELRWTASSSVPPVIAQYLTESVERLNQLIRQGDLAITTNGQIQPRSQTNA